MCNTILSQIQRIEDNQKAIAVQLQYQAQPQWGYSQPSLLSTFFRTPPPPPVSSSTTGRSPSPASRRLPPQSTPDASVQQPVAFPSAYTPPQWAVATITTIQPSPSAPAATVQPPALPSPALVEMYVDDEDDVESEEKDDLADGVDGVVPTSIAWSPPFNGFSIDSSVSSATADVFSAKMSLPAPSRDSSALNPESLLLAHENKVPTFDDCMFYNTGVAATAVPILLTQGAEPTVVLPPPIPATSVDISKPLIVASTLLANITNNASLPSRRPQRPHRLPPWPLHRCSQHHRCSQQPCHPTLCPKIEFFHRLRAPRCRLKLCRRLRLLGQCRRPSKHDRIWQHGKFWQKLSSQPSHGLHVFDEIPHPNTERDHSQTQREMKIAPYRRAPNDFKDAIVAVLLIWSPARWNSFRLLYYLLKAEDCLKREKDSVSQSLHSSSDQKLLEEVQHELLTESEARNTALGNLSGAVYVTAIFSKLFLQYVFGTTGMSLPFLASPLFRPAPSEKGATGFMTIFLLGGVSAAVSKTATAPIACVTLLIQN